LLKALDDQICAVHDVCDLVTLARYEFSFVSHDVPGFSGEAERSGGFVCCKPKLCGLVSAPYFRLFG
jgi:hypothetical protein